MPEISVLIPVFNVEPFLERCLKSLQAQSFTDWEAICVDDGSTDRCPEILDRFAAADDRFRVYHKPGGGVSSARNYAYDKIRGTYTLFLDADDFLHPQLMEICLHFARTDNSDLVCFTYDHPYHRRSGLPDAVPAFRHYDLERIRRRTVENLFDWVSEYCWRGHLLRMRWSVRHCQPWRCLYRSAVVKDLRFPEGIIFEDLPWWGEVLLNTGRATILNLPLYFYTSNPASYLNATEKSFRFHSLRTAIRLSEGIYAGKATPAQRTAWEKHFLAPFRRRLEKALRQGPGNDPGCGRQA